MSFEQYTDVLKLQTDVYALKNKMGTPTAKQ